MTEKDNPALEKLKSVKTNCGSDGTYFSEFSRQWIDKSEKYSIEKTFPKGALLFSEGDDSDGLYIIKEGKAKVFISDETGKDMTVAMLGPGEVIGEIASLDGQARTASVTAIEPTIVLKIAQRDFKRFLSDNQELAFEIIQVLTSRIRSYNTSVSNLAFKTVYERIVAMLEQNSESCEDGTRVVNGSFTHKDIADMVGASREMVSRVFSDLTKGEYISIDQRVITIHKKFPGGW